MDEFLKAYLKMALEWSGLDEGFSTEDFSASAREQAREECLSFVSANLALIEEYEQPAYDMDEMRSLSLYERAGKDFFLERIRTDAGFRDGDWPDDTAGWLSAAARDYPKPTLRVNEDREVYFTYEGE